MMLKDVKLRYEKRWNIQEKKKYIILVSRVVRFP